jgi:hypothetical protein
LPVSNFIQTTARHRRYRGTCISRQKLAKRARPRPRLSSTSARVRGPGRRGDAMIPIPRGYRRLEWSEHKPARGTRLVESANPREKVSVTIRVRRRPDAPPLRSRALDGEPARAAPVPLMRGVRRPVRRGPCGFEPGREFCQASWPQRRRDACGALKCQRLRHDPANGKGLRG